jgi:hypothetical protein
MRIRSCLPPRLDNCGVNRVWFPCEWPATMGGAHRANRQFGGASFEWKVGGFLVRRRRAREPKCSATQFAANNVKKVS